MGKAAWDSINKKEGNNIHESYGILAEDILKAALLSKSFDNVTAIVIGFSGSEVAYNKSQTKPLPIKSHQKNTLSLGSTFKDGLKGLPSSNRPNLSPTNNLIGSSQRGLANASETEIANILMRRESQPAEFSGGLTLNKEEIPFDNKSKGYLPHINKSISRCRLYKLLQNELQADLNSIKYSFES